MSEEHHVLHGLCYDRQKGRWKARFMIARGRKLVGKRLVVDIPTRDQDAAVLARNAVLCFCGKIGLVVIRRAQKRPVKEGGES